MTLRRIPHNIKRKNVKLHRHVNIQYEHTYWGTKSKEACTGCVRPTAMFDHLSQLRVKDIRDLKE